MTKDSIFAFANHVASKSLDDMPDGAIGAAKTFILDTLGVGISGGTGPMAQELANAAATMGAGDDAGVWGTGRKLPAGAAAWCNAYQAHCQEYDCVHEGAVAHVMTIVLPVALALSERSGGVSGKRLLEAVILGVDVASGLGVAAETGLRFFRPATVGAFGGVAAAGKILGFDEARLVEAFSLVYGQICGTMQAHTEGSGLLAMQVGFNARNAVAAVDLARAGFTGPQRILSGDFGYFRLIEERGDPGAVAAQLGQRWFVLEVAHKPFPSGRATHGILDGCLGLQRKHGFAAENIAEVRLTVPPLINHLVGRPPKTDMEINYARLCARYVLACAMFGGDVVRSDFNPDAYQRAAHLDLANRTRITVLDGGDPNALVPIGVEITLSEGRTFKADVEDVYGSPENPLSQEAHLAKFRKNCGDAVNAMSEDQVERMIDAVDRLEALEDVSNLVA